MSSDNTVRCDYMLPYFPKRIVCDALRAILWTACAAFGKSFWAPVLILARLYYSNCCLEHFCHGKLSLVMTLNKFISPQMAGPKLMLAVVHCCCCHLMSHGSICPHSCINTRLGFPRYSTQCNPMLAMCHFSCAWIFPSQDRRIDMRPMFYALLLTAVDMTSVNLVN